MTHGKKNNVNQNYISFENNKEYETNILNIIKNRLGIDIHSHQKQGLQKTIIDSCQKFNCSPEKFLELLTTSTDHSPLLNYFITRVTIGETYFFRDQHQMKILKDELFPHIIASKKSQNNLSIRIWSAGCSSGEEIYTIAMMLCELILDLSAWNIVLLGTDINPESLKKSIAGLYGEWSMRTIPGYYKNKYFSKKNNKYNICDTIRNMVNFSYLNLNDDTYPSLLNGTQAQDFIICRNVLIYFNQDTITEIMKKLSACLAKDGALMLGASDSINIKKSELVFNPSKGLFLHSVSQEKSIPTVCNSINKNKKNVTPPQKTIHSKIPVEKKSSIPPKEIFIQLLHENRWQELLNECNHYTGDEIKLPFLLSVKANALANLGQTNEAFNLCQQSLALDAMNKHTYLTLSLILTELNRSEEAEAALRKSIFIDSEFIFGHFQLGMLLLKNKKYIQGLKCLKNALIAVENKDQSQLISTYKHLRYKQLTDIIKHELDVHKDIWSTHKNHS